jgi:hypothetical protein
MVAADAGTAITFALSPGNARDAPEGRDNRQTNRPEGMQARRKELRSWKFHGVPPSSVKREYSIPDAA